MNNNILQKFNVQVTGQGDNYLVFGHGMGNDKSVWTELLGDLRDSPYRLICYDLVCAHTVNPDLYNFGRYSTIDSYVDDLLQILNALDVQCCTFIGHAFSAMIGILASIRRPDRFTKLILMGASARFVNDKDYYGGMEQANANHLLTEMQINYMGWLHRFVGIVKAEDKQNGGGESPNNNVCSLLRMKQDIATHCLQTVINTDIRSVLKQVKTSCHIIRTTNDPSVPMPASIYLEKNLGGHTTVTTLEANGHRPHLFVSEEMHLAVKRALSKS